MIYSSSFMGCGVSKFDLEDAGPTCDFKPVHRRNNNHATTYRPIGTKPSLEDGKNEDIIVEGRKSVSLTTKDKLFVKKTIDSREKLERGVEREKETRNEEVAARVVVDNEEGEEDGHSDEEEIGEDSILYPGSPSFREYCVCDPEDHHGKNPGDGAKSHKKSQKEEFLNSDKGSRTQSAKSGRKGRGIRNVLHKGGSSGVKISQNQKMVGKAS